MSLFQISGTKGTLDPGRALIRGNTVIQHRGISTKRRHAFNGCFLLGTCVDSWGMAFGGGALELVAERGDVLIG